MSTMTRSLWPVAFHEAGHAVVSTFVNVPFRAVVIRSSGEGCCVGTGKYQQLQRYEVHDHIVATLAGPYAEARIAKRSKFDLVFRQPDGEAALEMMRWLVDRGYVPNMRAAEFRFDEITRQVLDQAWTGVERVATALVQHRELTPGAVAALAGLPEVRL